MNRVNPVYPPPNFFFVGECVCVCVCVWGGGGGGGYEYIDEFTKTWKSTNPDSKVHGANMGPTWVLSAPDGPRVGPMNLAIRVRV